MEGELACPICTKPAEPRYRPFCSRRCADVDLARWFRADYALPGSPIAPLEPDDEEDPPHRLQ